MSGKYMKVKKIVIPTLTLILISSMLFGVSACSKKEAKNMSQQASEIEIEYAVPNYDSGEESKVELLPWLQLSSLETHAELRSAFEKYFNITGKTGNKEGTLYYNPATQTAEQNVTYLMATQNSAISQYLLSEGYMGEIGELVGDSYTDVEKDSPEAPYAVINSYFELLPDQEDGKFDGDSTISRAQAMALVMRATTQVNEAQAPEENKDFTDKVGKTTYTNFAAPMDEYSYINTSNGLNEKSFSSTMTKGEYIALVTNYLRANYLAEIEANGYVDNYSDTSSVSITTVKDAGDIKYQKAINDADKGVPTDLYNTFKVAIANGYLTEDTLSDWDSALTKADALELFTTMATNAYNTYQLYSDYIDPSTIANNSSDESSDSSEAGSDSSDSSVGNKEEEEIRNSKWADINGAWDAVHQYGQYAASQGADGMSGWSWIYINGKGAGDQPSYAVYMKEGDPDYGKVFHVGDTLPDGNKFNGTMEEYKEVLVKEGIEAAKEQGANVYTDENTGETVIEIK
jgi:hypothetical protein